MNPTAHAPPAGTAVVCARAGVPPPSRALRSAVAAGTATAFGATGHLLAGGTTTAAALVAALAAAMLPAWVLSARERSWAGIAALQIITQLVVHAALSAAAPPVDGAGLVSHDLMLHVHIIAGLIATAAMRVGERRLWATARRLAGRVAHWWRRLTAGGSAAVHHPPHVPTVTPAPIACARPLRHVRVLRGPPATV